MTPSKPANKPAATAAAPSAPKAASKAAAGTYGIQLGAFKSNADAANKRWTHLDKEYPKLLAGLSPTVSSKKAASGTLYRLQVVGLTEKHARSICGKLKAKSQACVVVPPHTSLRALALRGPAGGEPAGRSVSARQD